MSRRVVAALGAAGLLATVFLPAPRVLAAEPPATPVVVAPVREAAVGTDRSYVGSIRADRRGMAGVEIAGYVDSVDIPEGVEVGADHVLARLRTDTLVPRMAEAAAELDLRKQELAELEAGARPEEIEQAEAELISARADLDTYAWKLEATERLREQARVTEEELREARRMVETTRARIRRLEAVLALLREGPRAERKAQARARVAAQEAVVKSLEDEERRHQVMTPFPGIVLRRLVEPGTWVAPGQAVAELVDLTNLDVEVPVLEDDLASLREGMKVTVEVDALPGRLVTGTIYRLMPVVDPKARTLPVRVRLPGRDDERGRMLRPGMFCRVHIAGTTERQALVVPKDAIVLGQREPFVYVVDPESSTVRPVNVRLGVAVGDDIEVQGPLAAGMNVVIRGNERLRPGMPVRAEEAR